MDTTMDNIMEGVDNLLDSAKAELVEQQKNLEKQLIRSLVASSSYATSQNRKKLTRDNKKRSLAELKSISTSYKSSFFSSAKGQWVNQAKKSIQKVTDCLNKV
ncbi:hypothetical protein IA811_09445 [Listeria welshimeri]|nr:hypothetical protein [Listeria welshimeri]MBF2379653.1 hypothetical protein [Listeria welshimeri]MBF2678469.1 hypothetical protein [Listeria welshimeri]